MNRALAGPILAPAKINLALHVTGRRDDGYHALSSMVAFAELGDQLTVKASDTDALSVDGPFADAVPSLVANILGESLTLARAWSGNTVPKAVAIHLTKNLPVSSGIGGGSADAAALLRLLTRGRTLTAAEWADTLSLGADVPMCFRGTSALISGVGERIEPVELPKLPVVLANPGVPVSTPAVFQALRTRAHPPLPAYPGHTDTVSFVDWLQSTRNDLQTAAIQIEPKIQAVLSELKTARLARMSGSGATCFGLYGTMDEARDAADRIEARNPDWWVVATTLS